MTYPHAKLALTVYQIEQMVGVIMNVAAPVSSPLTADDIDYAIGELRTAFPITDDRNFTDATMSLRATNKAIALAEFNAAVKEEDRLFLIVRDQGDLADFQRRAVMRRREWLQNVYEAF